MNCVTIPVKGMNMNAVTKALKGIEGVQGVDIDLWQNIATVTYDETMTEANHLREVVSHTLHHSN